MIYGEKSFTIVAIGLSLIKIGGMYVFILDVCTLSFCASPLASSDLYLS